MIVGGSRGAVGAIDYVRASELGLGERRSNGYGELAKIHGTPVAAHGRDNVVIEGPLGGLALMGAVPLVSARYASSLDMDYEADRERLQRVAVTESIEQALGEVAEILETFGSGELGDSRGESQPRSACGADGGLGGRGGLNLRSSSAPTPPHAVGGGCTCGDAHRRRP